ncbi:CDK-activating kinase assembly factor MAT1 protein [Toxoplasma gondii RUB]|uniref:CDK-activating kinase assembly factor MAT1 protein n=13 Tax=Toxoplasma gondii TaxID=5811 RepID=B9QIC4_TOXGV|nr:CDK-activating kinase assembly factor MAT1 protein [Toxoplasma gondii VEG]KFG32563.1 CDK-activating kinase assembly factor MAT1 protein [Toxoplasma gondii GAB2-2007-GAL-DOM2]KFG58737.1 CDK-activating kinase assembly factor MAT1 protein [Toxoplasma gondii RUB]KFH03930.1 CDK-activating kinase assembly factor MAT1 protein [Toxoplasma gondii VAND]KFH11289.1 CDK-activating kinase assembly factor MAT1 protein [Toxoplasma gondii MAS]PUA88531.1 CDK-activating kinase assembly factor MAT1 protein [To
MDNYDCPVCYESCYFHPERKLFHSDVCKHRICGSCLHIHFGENGARGERRGFCPVCRTSLTRANYKETDPDMEVLETEKEIRRRVEAIYNSTRERFPDTPAYDDYREKKEDIVYQLVSGSDEAVKRKLEAELRAYERQNLKLIQENKEERKQREKEKIFQIVQREGIFYEVVKRRPALSRTAVDKEQLVHPLERQYAPYFQKEETTTVAVRAESGETARPLNPSIKDDADVPRPRYKNREQFEKAELASGYAPQTVFAKGLAELVGSVRFLLQGKQRSA